MVAVLVGLVCAAYLSLVRYGFNKDWGVFLVEETFFAQHARRVQLGALPYRDFSIPYTPGVFYLHAWLLEWLGPDLVVLRVPQVACRAVFCLALYAAGRLLMPPAFAALAPALLLGMDTSPPHWDVHPGWYAAPASVVTVWALARYVQAGRGRWLVGAGLAAGVGFAFKQNTALLSLMAVLWLLAVAESRLAPVTAPPWPRPARRPGAAGALAAAAPAPGGPGHGRPRSWGPASAGRRGPASWRSCCSRWRQRRWCARTSRAPWSASSCCPWRRCRRRRAGCCGGRQPVTLRAGRCRRWGARRASTPGRCSSWPGSRR